MKYISLTLALTLLTSCNSDGPLLLDSTPDQIAYSLDEEVPTLMKSHRIVGLSVAVIQKGKIVLLKSYGLSNIEQKQSTNKKTIYKAASLGKPVFAYVVTMLAQQGKIDLDRPLSDYLGKRILKDDTRSKRITARMILAHTSGLPNLGGKTQSIELHFNPGETFKYSGHGYLYLQQAVEKIAGKSLNELAHEIVFQPLQMTHSSYTWRDLFKSEIAIGYDEKIKAYPANKEPTKGYSAWSLYTNIEDYSKFVSHMITSSKYKNSVASLLLEPNVDVGDRVEWGLGWGLQKTKPNQSFWHWGSKDGFKHFVVGYPKEELAVIVMSNSRDGFKIIDEIMRMSIGGGFPSYDWF